MEKPNLPFISFRKIPRLSRQVIVTEKIDGTNASIYIPKDAPDQIYAGSRNRWLSTEDDNFGFAKWVDTNREELLTLGPGLHFGEWWGPGIQRGYGLKEKRFSLFNPAQPHPPCVHTVPQLWAGEFDAFDASVVVHDLAETGSHASPGFMRPEGIIIFHKAAGVLFKKTIDNDSVPKGAVEE